MNRQEDNLDRVFCAYRDATPVPEPGMHFMPHLWEKIDAQRTFAQRFKSLTQVFVGSAAVLCLLFTGMMVLPGGSASQSHAATYLDVLAEAHPTENLAAQGIVHAEFREVRH